jgi:hypothetical protein
VLQLLLIDDANWSSHLLWFDPTMRVSRRPSSYQRHHDSCRNAEAKLRCWTPAAIKQNDNHGSKAFKLNDTEITNDFLEDQIDFVAAPFDRQRAEAFVGFSANPEAMQTKAFERTLWSSRRQLMCVEALQGMCVKKRIMHGSSDHKAVEKLTKTLGREPTKTEVAKKVEPTSISHLLPPNRDGDAADRNCVWCSFSDRNVHSRMPLVPTNVHLKLLHACYQWHSSRVSTASHRSHRILRPNTEGGQSAVGELDG